MAYPPIDPITAMWRMFAPSVNSPPSENRNLWTTSTIVTARQPAQGPKIMPASTPPMRCPDTGKPIGKLTIWPAKIIAAVMPVSGTTRSETPSRNL